MMKIDSLVKRITGFADMIQLTHLKLQQVMSRMVPDGIYLDADKDLQEVGQKEAYLAAVVTYLEKVLREINNRNWTIRNTIEWKKFLHGE